jgi:hypothetical protein
MPRANDSVSSAVHRLHGTDGNMRSAIDTYHSRATSSLCKQCQIQYAKPLEVTVSTSASVNIVVLLLVWSAATARSVVRTARRCSTAQHSSRREDRRTPRGLTNTPA